MIEIRCNKQVLVNGEWRNCNKRLMFFYCGNAQVQTKCHKCNTEFIIELGNECKLIEKS
jgi:hypothetical protein